MSTKVTISKKDIETLNDFDLHKKVLEFIDEKIKEDPKNAHAVVTSLSKGMQMLYTTWWVEGEVNNGGFSQYFWNSASQFAKEAYYGFLAIGAKEFAKLMAEGMNLYIKHHAQIKKLQENGSLDGYTELENQEIFNGLDDKFYSLQEKEDIMKLRMEYIKSHIDEFISE